MRFLGPFRFPKRMNYCTLGGVPAHEGESLETRNQPLRTRIFNQTPQNY